MIQRKTGVAIWRQIADQIRRAISAGEFEQTGKLPSEMELANRFGVNRHTVRSAIAALAQEGLLRSEQGKGTHILRAEKLKFPISHRTRFSQGVDGQVSTASATVLEHGIEPAGSRLCLALGVSHKQPVLRIDMLYMADGMPVSLATNWFEAESFKGMAEACLETGSITKAYQRLGIKDYIRLRTEIAAGHAQERDLVHLRLSPGAVVIEAFSVNARPDGSPIQAALTRFAADRVTLQIGQMNQ